MLVEPNSPFMPESPEANVAAEQGAAPEPQEARGPLELRLAMAAHELRGPLFAAKAAIEAYLANDRRPVSGPSLRGRDDKQLLEGSVEQLNYLAAAVDGLLGPIHKGSSFRLAPTDLVQVAKEAIASTTPGPGPSRVVLSGPECLMILGSPLHLRSVLCNLLRNALAYSPQGTPVYLTVGQLDRTAMLAVEDQGDGIPPAEREAIFDPLTRGSSGRHAGNGSGLGLYIAREFVHAHGGRIMLESPDKGRVVFRIELPVEQRGLGRPAVPPDPSLLAIPMEG
jgi:two-component system OmpR family sensor kinase